MKKLVLGMVACLALVAASPSFANTQEQDDAAALIMENYKDGTASESDAREMITKVFTPYETGEFAAFLLKKLYQGGKWVVVNGAQTGWSYFMCVVDTGYETIALGACKTVALTQGADARRACWEKAYSSESLHGHCIGKKKEAAPAVEAPAVQ